MCQQVKTHGSEKQGSVSPCTCGGCGCGCGSGFRRFYSDAEQLERLHAYLDQLRKEAAGVEERIKEIRP